MKNPPKEQIERRERVIALQRLAKQVLIRRLIKTEDEYRYVLRLYTDQSQQTQRILEIWHRQAKLRLMQEKI